ncbi:pyridoxal 5'-phosphate synthase glutaminase subunit PdxT [Cellulomonas soli]|uniref:Pyridoxal 5'-phosphate synthase subunit PdxT n=1 Tax=Cellulomonas soli TaxID=931535 RepID=A0A512PA45_9CELL|nr:pyridoxal 5'-phosphate synthase glutaminase subunit PdxT [Cellulomonas soli]NYI60565.1 5'-phosphate synthase pdxT subunit [Cellulomonas soli]GEP68080.1 pyridoxal 5'-phosphate synthase subunit PdxT [Cellulomonas soli]
MSPTIGVLSLQGDVREHVHALEAVGARAVGVRRASELEAVDALVIPGGESTTIDKLLRAFDLFDPVQLRLRQGMPAYGSCAGMILLADRVIGAIEGQRTLGGVDITVRRNAFGRQVDSFETDLTIDGVDDSAHTPLHAVFIRAPWVEEVGPAAAVLGRVDGGPSAGRIVAVRQGPLLVTSFHPEVTGDTRVHRLFVQIVRDSL